jgi:hypothetical protein
MHLDESGESREDLRSWRESEGENAEAVEAASPSETHVLLCGVVEGDVEVGVPQVYGCRPIAWSEGVADIFDGLHAEVGGVQVRRIQLFQVEYQAHTPTLFWDEKDGTDVA